MAKRVFLVCTQCQTPNPRDARKCNGCGRGLSQDYPFQAAKYIVKWACDECGELNMGGNMTCINLCNAKDKSARDGVMDILHDRVDDVKGKVIEKRNEAIKKGLNWLFDKIEGKK